MKIAVVTDDGQTVCQHFGRAAHYLVFTVEDGKITGSELRDKFSPHRDEHGSGDDHDHHHHNDPHEHSGPEADAKHSRMIDTIQDCQIVVVGGIGQGALNALSQANLETFRTNIPNAREAVETVLIAL